MPLRETETAISVGKWDNAKGERKKGGKGAEGEESRTNEEGRG